MIRLLRGFLANIALLSIALAAATAVWVVAQREANPEETRQFTAPIQIENAPELSRISLQHEQVELLVEGRRATLDGLANDAFIAFVDLGQMTGASSELEIQTQVNPEYPDVQIGENVDIALKTPQDTLVEVEEIASRSIPVVIDVQGSVAIGYRFGDPVSDPMEITLTGSASRVNDLQEARITVFLDNVRETRASSRRPIFYDKAGEIANVSGLDLSAEFVQVTIPVEQLEGVANKPVTAVWTGQVSENYQLLNVFVEPSSVLVAGLPATLDALRILNTESIDIGGLQESDTFQVGVVLPEGVMLVDPQPFFVTVEVEPLRITSLLEKPIEIRAINEGFSATLSAETVRVLLYGPKETLDSLQEDDVRVTLDLLNLEPGKHSLEPNVTLSVNDLETRSVQPSVITVDITGTLPITDDGSVGSIELPATMRRLSKNIEAEQDKMTRIAADIPALTLFSPYDRLRYVNVSHFFGSLLNHKISPRRINETPTNFAVNLFNALISRM